MPPADYPTLVAFVDGVLLARGPLPLVASAAKAALDAGATRPIQVFDAATSEPWDLDLGGTPEDVAARHRLDDLPRVGRRPRRGVGSARLGVEAREVALLPRHWEWLAEQPGGASAALRRLVDAARVGLAAADAKRRARDRTYRFLVATLGDAEGFEEATRALWRGDRPTFVARIAPWPTDLRDHLASLAEGAFDG